MKPSAGTLSMLRPACVGIVWDVACARNARQRSTVRSSSRSISAMESLISATRMARRCRGEVTPWKARGSCIAGLAAASASGRTSPASRSRAATSQQHQAAVGALEQSLAHQARELARDLLARGAHAAGDVVVRRRGIERARGCRSMPATRARRSSSTQMRRCTGCAPSSSRRSASSRTEPVRRRSRRSRTEAWLARIGAERLGRHRGEQRFAQRQRVGEARAAVDRRMLAEHLARREVAEDDAPAAPGRRAVTRTSPAITKYTSRSVPSRWITTWLRLQRVHLHCAAISRSV